MASRGVALLERLDRHELHGLRWSRVCLSALTVARLGRYYMAGSVCSSSTNARTVDSTPAVTDGSGEILNSGEW